MGGGPEYFTVKDKEGTIREYGHTSDSRILTNDGNVVMTWKLNKIIDASGNYIDFIYDAADRESLLSEIRYTGNDAFSLAPYNSIKFFYINRSDKNVLYESGSSLLLSKLLYKVEVSSEGTTYKSYQFSYGTRNGSSYLNTIEEFAADNSKLNDLRFFYGDLPASDFEVVKTNLGLDGSREEKYFGADFNGDGVTDVINCSKNSSGSIDIVGHYTSAGSSRYSRGKAILGVSDVYGLGAENYYKGNGCIPSDFDGDGREELLTMNFHQYYYYNYYDAAKIYTPDNTSSIIPTVTCAAPSIYTRVPTDISKIYFTGDFDGDKRSDYLQLAWDFESLTYGDPGYMKKKYVVFFTSPSRGLYSIPIKVASSGLMDVATGNHFYEDGISVIDFDGNGRSDIFGILKDDPTSYYVLSVDESPSGAFSFTRMVGGNFSSQQELNQAADFNGDGKTDLLLKSKSGNNFSIAYSRGEKDGGSSMVIPFDIKTLNFTNGYNKECTYSAATVSGDALRVADFNGDGKSDILHIRRSCDGDYFTKTYFDLYLSSGIAFVYKTYSWPGFIANIDQLSFIGDMNGDGKADFSFVRAESPVSYLHTLYFQGNSNVQQLAKVLNGFNKVTEFEYTRLPQASLSGRFIKGTGMSYPYLNAQYPLSVATSKKESNGIGGNTEEQFSYENLVIHRTGLGMLGFQKTTTINGSTDIKTESFFDFSHTIPSPGPVKVKCFLFSTGELLDEKENIYTHASIAGTKCFKIDLSKTVETDYLKGITNVTENAFDADGNLSKVESIKTGGPESFFDKTEITYAAIGASRVPNKPVFIKKTLQRGTKLASVQNTSLTYDYIGKILSKKTQFDGSSDFIQENYDYNRVGNIISKQIAGTGLTPKEKYYWYDSKCRFVTREINELGDYKTATWHPFWGTPVEEIGFDGLTKSTTYDVWGRKISHTTQTSPTSFKAVNYSYVWSLSGNKIFYSIATAAGAPDVKTFFDLSGRIVASEEEGFSADVLQENQFDGKGNVVYTTNKHYSSETPRVTRNYYDRYNRLSSVTDYRGTTSYSYSYSGGLLTTTETSPDGKIKTSVTDASGKVVQCSDGVTGVVHFQYNSQGNQISSGLGTTKAPYANLIQKEYDAWGHLTKMSDADAGKYTYTYNVSGDIISMTDPKGKSTTYTYDKSGRLTNAKTGGIFKAYNYYGKEKGYKLKEMIFHSAAGVGMFITKSFDYEIGGLLVRQTLTLPTGAVQEKTFSYDNNGRLSSTNYVNSGLKTKNVYNSNGYLTKVTTNLASGGTEKILYEVNDANGENQPTHIVKVDGLNELIDYTNGFCTGLYTPAIQSLDMAYNFSNGNMISRQDNISHTQETFYYDGADRLIKSASEKMGILGTPGTIHAPIDVTYDAQFYGSFGRIMSKSDVGNYKYGSAPRNAVASVTDPDVLISRETQDIEYNDFNKVNRITERVGTSDYEEQFWYDAEDLRVTSEQKRDGILFRRRTYFGDYEEQYDLSSGTTKKLHYITGVNGTVGVVVVDGSTGVIDYYAAYTDHLGSLVCLTNESAVVVGRQSFDAWGRTRNPDTWGYVPSAGVSPGMPEWIVRGYTGHEMLPEYGLINMNGRMYDPANGRMLSADKYIQNEHNAQAYNRYSYCLNNPLKLVDPTGDQYSSTMDYGYSYNSSYSGSGVYYGVPYSYNYQQWFGVYSHSSFEESNSGFSKDVYLVTTRTNSWGQSFSGSVGNYGLSFGVNFVSTFVSRELVAHTDNMAAVFDKFSKSFQSVQDLGVASQRAAEPGWFSWDGPIVRNIVPDFISVGGGFNSIYGVGTGTSFDVTWITHGPEKSLYPAITVTQAIGAAYSVDATFNITQAKYSGSASLINRGMLVTNSVQGAIPTFWGSAGIALGGKISVTGMYTRFDDGSYISAGQINLGLGLPIGPVPVNAAAGVSNTWLVKDFYER
ncbi:MAG: RHS repeat-associated core domain-containing protein [Chitinophagaceae bacterium]